MSKKGKTPSLIGGGAGAVRFVEARRARPCKRCAASITKNEPCLEVKKPGTMGHRTYCVDCFTDVLGQTQLDLNTLVDKVAAL